MSKGEGFPVEWSTFTDAQTDIEVRQLTNHRGHSHHLYFTNPGWYDEGRKLLFGSDRGNSTNLFSLDLASGEITQLTDLEGSKSPGNTPFQSASINPQRPEVYFWYQDALMALDLESLEQRALCEAQEGFQTSITNVTADGKSICTVVIEKISGRFQSDIPHAYVGFEDTWAARPLCRILCVDADTGRAECVHEERCWIGHINTSPKLPHILTFCHEGPWHKVDNRIWGLDLTDGKVWPIRQGPEGERVGHEYWFSDGEHIGYHGSTVDGKPFYGSIKYDDTGQVEAPFPHGSTHFHSNDLGLIVGDGSRNERKLLLWRFRDGRFDGPKVVLTHYGSFQVQMTHVHPRFSPDGRQILFTSDAGGYGNLYLVNTPDFDALPDLD